MFRVICINDTNRPNEIPANRWVEKGQVYTVVKVDKLNAQGGIHGYKLKELNIDDLAPYQYFASDRFAVIVPLPALEFGNVIETEEKLELA